MSLYYTEKVSEISRRGVLKGMGALALGIGAGSVAHGYVWERHALRLVQVDLPVSGLARALDGFRVGFISDLHHSAQVSRDDVLAAVGMIQAQSPDLIVLGGDYVSFADRQFVAPVAEMLGTLRAPHGVFAILGNHDDDRYMPAALEDEGIVVLKDARTTLAIRGARLELAGLRFWSRRMEDVVELLTGSEGPVLLLAHDPRRIVEAATLDVPAVLSGHTHGGQIVVPGLGAIAARKFPTAKGRLTREGTELYVTAGVGTVVLPIRVNCPPEVAVVTLRSRGLSTPAA
jgi:predicted MPP superfamily phosphohydrolase